MAGVALDDQGRVLIAKRKTGGSLGCKWEFPGGKLEPGETAEEGLRREFREELAVDVAVGPNYATGEFAHKGVPFVLEAYGVELLSRRFRLNEHERLEWVPPDRLAEYDLAASDRCLLPQLLNVLGSVVPNS